MFILQSIIRIRENKITRIPSMIQGGAARGMQTMDQALMRLIEEGRITPEAAYEKAIDKSLFLKIIKEKEAVLAE